MSIPVCMVDSMNDVDMLDEVQFVATQLAKSCGSTTPESSYLDPPAYSNVHDVQY
eukprot:m.8796 g.8796  ORF g.8796 m.8796 type:complete len:55 (-) comp3252_c0_seq1:20-184(-)